MSVQSKAALQLHLGPRERQQDFYRLSAIGTDNCGVNFQCMASITLSKTGVIRSTNQRHLNTLIMEKITD